MATTVVIGLDTTAPVVTWGPTSGEDADEDFQILYALDEPDLLSAQLELIDGRLLDLTVASDRLSVHLPVDSPRGLATIYAQVRDDLGNSAVRETQVLLDGVLFEPPVPTVMVPQPGQTFSSLPSTARTALPETRRVHSRADVHTRHTRRISSVETRRAAVRSRTNAQAGEQHRVNRVVTRSRVQTTTEALRQAQVAGASGYAVVRRGDGPEAEAEIFLLL